MTAAVIIRHRVANFEAWKTLFDGMAEARLAHGWMSTIVFRDEVDPNVVTIVNRVKDLDGAKRYASSSELRTAMQNAGVHGVPEIFFVQEVEERRA